MKPIATVALLLASALHGAEPLDSTLAAIEARYNKAQSLRLEFSETYLTSRRPSKTETGVLYLKKPGRMRWEYTEPAGKLFLADGKDTWLYSAAERRAEKATLKGSDDERAPLAFLLGKLDFRKDFQSVTLAGQGAGQGSDAWIVALPKSQTLPYVRVEFQADATGQIRRVRVTAQDQSKLEFEFSKEQLNVPVGAGMFTFQVPEGVEVVRSDR